MKKYVALAALAAAFCLTSCGAKKVNFSELEKTCTDTPKSATDPRYVSGPTVAIEGYLTGASQRYSSEGVIRITEDRDGNSRWIAIEIKQGTQSNQLELTKTGDAVSSFRLYTNDGDLGVPGDRILVTVDVTGVPLNHECIFQAVKIKKS
jgi:hypothetical protein